MKMLLLLGLFLGLSFNLPSQVEEEKMMQTPSWQNWEEGVEMVKKDGKFALVLIAKNGCTLTNHFLKSTFSDDKVKKILEERFVPIHLHIAQPIMGFTPKTPGYPRGLEQLIENKKLASPTLVVLDRDLKVLQSFSGYIPADKLSRILAYYGEGHYRNTPWEKFCKGN